MTLDLRGLTGLAMILLLAAALGVLMFVRIPDANRDLAIALITGVLGASVKDIVGYYFGSSKGSASKDETIARLSARNDPPA